MDDREFEDQPKMKKLLGGGLMNYFIILAIIAITYPLSLSFR